MVTAGSNKAAITKPRWLLAELTYACPLQCPYCSNPLDFAHGGSELATADWLRVFEQARRMGAVQLGLSGGEPLLRKDLETLVQHARELGYYTNLITSGYGLSEQRIAALKSAGLDHIQISIQAATRELNDYLAGAESFEHKRRVAHWVKEQGYPMVLCVVIHRHNIGQIRDILDMAVELNADYLELANTQYYGWALHNRDQLLPSRDQFEQAEAIANEYKARLQGRMKIYYVVPDYYENRPKACMNGWGTTFLTIAPDGAALPCHAARILPGLDFPNVRDFGLEEIWHDSPAFNRFRGYDWMREPCRSCPEQTKDFGGCRCQAYLLTGDPTNADPVCDKSPHHTVMANAIANAAQDAARHTAQPLVFRNTRTSKVFSGR